jgi:hypothetical protein
MINEFRILTTLSKDPTTMSDSSSVSALPHTDSPSLADSSLMDKLEPLHFVPMT